VITDPEVWRRVVLEVAGALEREGAAIMGVMASPLTGADGNVEFLVHARTDTTSDVDVGAAVAAAIAEAAVR
jgi:23S rRNA (cytidine1920-2'-O)/16S rRNA (cytidine1409-2'-O)-methyltransferase